MAQKQFNIRAPKELMDAMQKEAEKQNRPLAWIMRAAFEEYLKVRGYEIKTNIVWGGYRERKEADAE